MCVCVCLLSLQLCSDHIKVMTHMTNGPIEFTSERESERERETVREDRGGMLVAAVAGDLEITMQSVKFLPSRWSSEAHLCAGTPTMEDIESHR